MSVTRVGTNKKYSDNWDNIFSGRKGKSTVVTTPVKAAKKSAKKKPAGKAAKKSAGRKSRGK